MDVFAPMIHAMIVFVVLLGIALAVKIFFAKQRQSAPSYPYEMASALFTPAERSFLGVLEQACAGQYRIMGKVRLADIITVKTGLSPGSRRNAFNRIQSKHIDFVLCDVDDLRIQCAIELDDKSHQRDERRQRDDFVDAALKAAGVPIFRFPAKHGYSVEEVRRALFDQPAVTK